jgi:hypothetical protein
MGTGRRWRVTLRCRDSRTPEPHDPEHYARGHAQFKDIKRCHPDVSGLSYEQHGPDVWVSVNVAATNAAAAADLGKAILLEALPTWLIVDSAEARPLKAEPDFT